MSLGCRPPSLWDTPSVAVGSPTLAEQSSVSVTTISQFENGRASYESTGQKLTAAFEAHGVELVADDVRTGAVLVYGRRKD